ncbi:helix-turn-helix transcriptional regulator [Microbacterium flavescens]|uniref:helix-turn-helix transcriptional regulator n=1 Tax=Microbacterium flavescens TaxID=69366 RepID=UPI001BDE4732|nr:helix-turn-helix transcriptional regulator [Microbacterium flavescens]
MLDPASSLAAGRQAYAASDWSGALAGLSAAREDAPLDADDVAAMARAAWWLGRMPDSLAFAEEAFRGFLETDRNVDAAMTALQLGLLWITRGDLTIGNAWVHRARRLLADEPDGPAHAYLAYLDASLALMFQATVDWDEHVDRLADLARRFPDPAVEALALAGRGLAALRSDDSARGFALLDEAMLPVLAGRLPAEWAGDIYCTVIHVSHELAEFRRMEEWTRATERWCEQFGSESIYTGICRVHRMELRSDRGEWTDAEDSIVRECADLAGGNPWVAGEGFYQLGELRRRRGDRAGAREAYALARASGIDPQPGEALLLLEEGDAIGARTLLTLSLAERDALARVRLLRAAVEVALACGDSAGAASAANELRQAADRFASAGFATWSAHADGMVALAAGDHASALAALRRAEASFRGDRQLYELARVLLLEARAHEKAGDAAAAGAARDHARGILDRLGARVEEGVARAPAEGPLTPREREVLALVAEGAGNREVAQGLYISEKTVGRHLANVYLKIGVGTRTAAAAWWHAQRAAGPGGGHADAGRADLHDSPDSAGSRPS